MLQQKNLRCIFEYDEIGMERLDMTVGKKPWKMLLIFLSVTTMIILTLFRIYNYTEIIDIWIPKDKSSSSFNFLNLPSSHCTAKEKLIILVHSSPGNFDRRTTVRETWGSDATDNGIKVYFMVGKVQNKKTDQKIMVEMKKYKDFVQGNFVDSYRNLTYKHVMNFKYVISECSNVAFALKVDDDVFVNVPALLKFLELYKWKYSQSTNILCRRRQNVPVSKVGKWEVSEKEYAENTYPTHCLGFAILYPLKTMSLLYSEFLKGNFFWIDDVFVTGILAAAQGIQHTDLNDLIYETKNFKNDKPFLFGGVNINKREIHKLWNYTRHNPTKCSVLDYLK